MDSFSSTAVINDRSVIRIMNKERVTNLAAKAKELRRLMITMCHHGDAGHVGGSLSSAEIMAVLFWDEMRLDPARPGWEERDRFVLSKGHCTPALYSTLASRGYFPLEWLDRFGLAGSPLQKHPDMHKVPGVEISSGSLGQGFSAGVGMALGAKKRAWPGRVYVLLGDGEIQEGQVWEAAMFAAHYGLDNLVAIVDRNMLQVDGRTDEISAVEPLFAKWEAFGWYTQAVEGNDVASLLAAFAKARETTGRPNAIIARTIKGKGCTLTEDRVDSHHRAFDDREYEQAMRELA